MTEIVKLVEAINEFFGCDAAYYDVNPFDLATHLIAKGCRLKKENDKNVGKWLNWQGEPIAADDYWRVWRCSECNNEMEFDEAVDREEFPSNFCPNCGADMRGTEDV